MRKRFWCKSHAALLASRAAEMRACPSPPEAVLWVALVNSKLEGVPFRRQVVLAGYICDFVAASHKLVVEVDGGHHDTRAAADARRDRKLERLGYRVLRIPAQLVMLELPVALERVRGRGRGKRCLLLEYSAVVVRQEVDIEAQFQIELGQLSHLLWPERWPTVTDAGVPSAVHRHANTREGLELGQARGAWPQACQ